ncbi:transcriptional regulator, TetR family [Microbacterium sp. LKL04]|nr:TetR family transcriptional regulator [Microbacterium sp. SORGH_AS_0505]MDQ1124969.1 AcrR family transcriptional regulator [Microbacterium sp. SORGH_AS_0505]SCY33180.1 transcriptional regulator, TetR family [Microbacterium sp. LKL04]
MRRMPPEERRDELIAAAIRVIARRGVAAATTRAITAEAGMPLGAFTYIFGTQDELMTAVIDTVIAQERFAAESRAIDPTSLTAAIRSGLEGYIDMLEQDPADEIALLELALVARRRDPQGQMRAQWRTYYDAAEQMLAYAAEITGNRWTAPLSDLARHLVVIADGITTTWLADGDSDAARRTASFAAAALAAASAPLEAPTEGSPHADGDR